MNSDNTSTEFSPFPRDESTSWAMPREEATVNIEDVEEKTVKSKQRLLLVPQSVISVQQSR